MWKPSTMPASSAAAHSGSQLSWFQSRMPVGHAGRQAHACRPIAAACCSSATASPTSSSGSDRGGHEAVGRDALDLDDHPLVLRARRGADQLAVLDQRLPQAERRVHRPRPRCPRWSRSCDPGVEVARARRHGRAARRSSSRLGVLLRHDLGSWRAEALAVDVDDLLGRRRSSRCAACGRRARRAGSGATDPPARGSASRRSWPRS